MTQIAKLVEAMKAQIVKPTRAVVNSECAFVMERLYKMDEPSLAAQYWNWTCSDWKSNPKFGDEVQELQTQLRAIDAQSTMPSWGTYGT
jgi:hypothetical protein